MEFEFLISQARLWLLKRFEGSESAVQRFTDNEVWKATEAHYEGGFEGFARDLADNKLEVGK